MIENPFLKPGNGGIPKFRWAIWTGIVLAFGIFLTYASFVHEIRKNPKHSALPEADAIVVLTGENQRITSAIALLNPALGQRLLISGVDRKVTKDLLRNALAANSQKFNCCVDLDYLSADTMGNAENTSFWAKYNDYRHLVIVTSDYHLPRAMVAMHRAMPEMRLTGIPVKSHAAKDKSFIAMLISSVVLMEFGKYVVASLGMEPAAKYLLTTSGSRNITG